MASSLDLVESCLTQIYTCRKNLLHQKVKSATARIDARRQLQEKLGSPNGKNRDLFLETNDEDDERELLAKSLSSSYPTAPKPSSPNTSTRKAAATSVNMHNKESPQSVNTKQKENRKVDDNEIEIDHELGKTLLMNKEQLQELRKEFDTETYDLERRFTEHALERDMDDELEDMITKYFFHNLDRVTPSEDVSTLRQYISNRIEYLACLEEPPLPKGKTAKKSDLTVSEEAGEADVAEKRPEKKPVIDVNDPEVMKARLRTMMKRDQPRPSNAPPSHSNKESNKQEDSDEDEEDDNEIGRAHV